MARSAFTTIVLPDTGYNVTDSADFVALSTGAGNGKEIVYDPAARIILKNTTGGPAVFTIDIPTPAQYSSLSLTLSDMAITVAAAKTWEVKPLAVMKQADDKIYIDCDVAGSLLVLK